MDSFESYKNCCSGDEKYQFIFPEHLGETHEIRRRLLSLAESALACCGDLDNWTAKSFCPEIRKILGEFLAARILPAFIEQGPKYDMEKWWSEAAVLMNAGMWALPPALQPDTDAPDFDAEYFHRRRSLSRAKGASEELRLST